MQTMKLMKLWKHLIKGKLGHEVFDFNVVNSNINSNGDYVEAIGCGTNGCALGELPFVFPKDWHFDNGHIKLNNRPYIRKIIAAEYFGITTQDIDYLFYPKSMTNRVDGLPKNATRQQVADRLINFIQTRYLEQ